MDRKDVAAVLSEIATLAEIHGENVFRIRAFAGAARALEGSDADLEEMARAGRLTELRGIGPAIQEVVRELVETGRSTVHDELRAATPIGLYDLMRIPGLGPRKIRALHAGLGVDSLDALERAARAGEVVAVPGFGAKTVEKILAGIVFARASLGRRRYPEALETAVRLLDWLRERPGVAAAEIAGGVRRRLEVVEEVVLVAAAEERGGVLDGFAALNGIVAVVERGGGERVVVRLVDGIRAELRCVPPERFVGTMVWETGSEAHLEALAARAAERGLALGADGLRRGREVLALAAESALYEALDLAYVPPEMREGMGEVEEAARGPLPRLVELSDLRGTFHCHTTWSDGRGTVAEMAEAARAKGWEYLGLADHSKSAGYAGGLPVARVRAQHREIDAWNRAADAAGDGGGDRFRLFKGTESDILPDGSLDYPDAVLATFDYVVGSVHSSFAMAEPEMTARMVRAVRNPYLTMLGHPTGRLLLTRDAYAVDVRAVLDAAAEAGVIVEINANPHRLDLDWRHLRYATGRGILIAINPDAHSTRGLDHVAFGVDIARKAGLEPRQVINTWTLDEVERYLAERKQKA